MAARRRLAWYAGAPLVLGLAGGMALTINVLLSDYFIRTFVDEPDPFVETPGTMTPQQYDESVADLVAYLQWMGEPAQGTRFRLGIVVVLFLLGFTVFAWRLNASFWKDIK